VIVYDPSELCATNTTRWERKPVLVWWFEGRRICWMWLKEEHDA